MYFSENATHQNSQYFQYYDHDDGSQGIFLAAVNVGDSADGASCTTNSIEPPNGKDSIKGEDNGNVVYVIHSNRLSYP